MKREAVQQAMRWTAMAGFLGVCAAAAGAQAGASANPASSAVPTVSGQHQTAPAPAPTLTAPAPAAPVSATAAPAPAVSFPPVEPRNFTATTPTVDTVNSFLHALWGFDENRIWSVAAIQPTPAPGVIAVHVFVAEKQQASRLAQTTLYITPDGKHAIAGDVVRFGAQPFAEVRDLLAKGADGPARGAADKQLELVEFTDLECKACKGAQATLDQLGQQFPQAHIVVENMPQTAHPHAYRAAAVGYCVRQSKGDAGYATYAARVFAAQAELTGEKTDATLSAAAGAAGADPAAMLACAAAPATKAAVDAVVQLGTEAGVTDVPTLAVNGRLLPMASIPLPTMERIVVFQGKLDGFTVRQQPSLSTLK